MPAVPVSLCCYSIMSNSQTAQCASLSAAIACFYEQQQAQVLVGKWNTQKEWRIISSIQHDLMNTRVSSTNERGNLSTPSTSQVRGLRQFHLYKKAFPGGPLQQLLSNRFTTINITNSSHASPLFWALNHSYLLTYLLTHLLTEHFSLTHHKHTYQNMPGVKSISTSAPDNFFTLCHYPHFHTAIRYRKGP